MIIAIKKYLLISLQLTSKVFNNLFSSLHSHFSFFLFLISTFWAKWDVLFWIFVSRGIWRETAGAYTTCQIALALIKLGHPHIQISLNALYPPSTILASSMKEANVFVLEGHVIPIHCLIITKRTNITGCISLSSDVTLIASGFLHTIRGKKGRRR